MVLLLLNQITRTLKQILYRVSKDQEPVEDDLEKEKSQQRQSARTSVKAIQLNNE